MKTKLTFVVALLLLPLVAFSQQGLKPNSKLKICYNAEKDILFVSGKCKGNSVRLNYDDFNTGVLGSIPSGMTVKGVVGGGYSAEGAGASFENLSSLSAMTSQVFDNENDIQVANTLAVNNECGGLSCLSSQENSGASRCTGSPEVPTAPAGVVCIYPTKHLNAEDIYGFHVTNTANSNTPVPTAGGVGFGIAWIAPYVGDTVVEAVWAYTAP